MIAGIVLLLLLFDAILAVKLPRRAVAVDVASHHVDRGEEGAFPWGLCAWRGQQEALPFSSVRIAEEGERQHFVRIEMYGIKSKVSRASADAP